jgi:hypothetical protein
MKQVTITEDDILLNFCRLGAITTPLHMELVEAARKGVTVDKKGDFCVLGHWVTTDFQVTREGVNKFCVETIYDVHENAKCSDIMYRIIR